jgi:hypothetical protein
MVGLTGRSTLNEAKICNANSSGAKILKSDEESKERNEDLSCGPERGSGYQQAAYVFLGLLVAYAVVRGIRTATVRPFWFDEVYTLVIAQQPTLRDLWTVWKHGIDAEPPLFFLIERLMLTLPIAKEVSLRLPSIAAFCGILVCVFVYLRRRSGDFVAFVCALVLLSTSLFHIYLIEARPYALMVGCIAFALVCYQRLPSRNYTILFFVSLLIAELLHYYAVFAMIPFWIAESVFSLKSRRFRWGVWGGLVCAALPLVVSLSWLLTIRKYLGAHVFARPEFSQLKFYYVDFFLLDRLSVAGVVVFVAIAAVLWNGWPWTQSGSGNNGKAGARETALTLSLVALPYIVFLLTRMVNGLLLPRYVLPTIIGVAFGWACALSFAGRTTTAIFLALALCVTGVRELEFWRQPQLAPYQIYFSATSRQQLRDMKDFINSAGHKDLPVVMSDCLLYTQFVHYLDPNFTERLVYLVDREREYKYSGADTSSATMVTLRSYYPVQVAEYSQFTGRHAEFLLYVKGLAWYPRAFAQDNFSLVLLTASSEGLIFLVRTTGEVGD